MTPVPQPHWQASQQESESEEPESESEESGCDNLPTAYLAKSGPDIFYFRSDNPKQ